MKKLLVGLAFALAAMSYSPAHAETWRTVRVSFYLWTGNVMANGEWPHEGAAACSWDLSMYTRIRFPDGRVVVCKDRGLLGANGWVDIYVPSYWHGLTFVEGAYGIWSDVEVVYDAN